jgi:hypothetical protein
MPSAAQPVVAAAAVEEEDKEPEDDEGKVVYYHKKFWEYASYYGKKAAREFYGDWSPAEDAPTPAGVVIKEDTADTTTDTAAPIPAATEENFAAAVTDATADAAAADADAGTNDDANTGADVDDDAAPLTEEEEKAHAEEVAAYKAQYRTWWIEHGKASGAPEEPPALE